MTKEGILEALADMPDETELEIHIEHEDGSSDYALEAIGPVSGADNPPFFTFRAGDLISDCG